MAEDQDGREFLLLSSCLSEDMDFLENKLPCEFPYMVSVPSPIESVVSSTETESDEEEYLVRLTQLMAYSTLENDGKNVTWKLGEMASSPQSTLCSMRSWSAWGSNGMSQASSPPLAPLNRKNDGCELLHAASGQLAGLKMSDEGPIYHGRGLLGEPKKLATIGLSKSSVSMKTADVSGYPALRRCWRDNNRDCSSISMQIEMLKQQQQTWCRQAKISEAQQIQGRAKPGTNVKNGRPLGLPSSAWPPLQNNTANTGNRAVSLGSFGSRLESAGTGVFLPRRAGNRSDFRKKSGCSTVLLPARVVQALNLNVDNLGAAQPNYYLGRLVHGRDPSIKIEPHPFVAARNGFLPPQKRSVRSQLPTVSNELPLPQEWMY